MNNADLTPHEEKLTRYLDGMLTAAEAVEFEREHPEAAAERADADRLRATLRAHCEAPEMRNADFFNRQIQRAIAPAVEAEPRRASFPLWRLVFAGAACALAAAGIYKAMVPTAKERPDYMAQVTNVSTDDASLKTRVIQGEGITLVMIDGLEAIPEDYVLN